jgi:hypothetical protein
MSSRALQRRALELAYDRGADRHEIAVAIEALRADQADLIVGFSARRLSVRTALRAARSGFRNGKQHKGEF